MNFIKEFFWDIKPQEVSKREWKIRRTVRALIKHNNRIAVIHSTTRDFYKCLPGGGVDENEDLLTALNREIREEVGCKIKIIDELGMCIEYVGERNTIEISFVYVAEVVGELQKPLFTDEDVDAGFVLEWHTINETLTLVDQAKPSNKRGGQQMYRERDLLQYYLLIPK